ncbi:MAG TPA: PhzF family phenazine biosynthesis protein [Polyangiaceae bacterium]|jgi:PhzF family phenazine biosynthesis protein
MQIPLWQVDAFTGRPFGGNPAAVCPLEQWLPIDVLQAIAAENNLSETAFFVHRPDGDLDLRWFTPRTEVDLCGHATLASAWVLMRELDRARERVVFHTKSGPLTVTRSGDDLAMDLPARPPRPVESPAALARALGAEPSSTLRARDLVAVFERSEQVRGLAPVMAGLEALEGVFAVCVTAPGTGADADVDFVSRFFAPAKGVPEDPVTGSSHATLVPYWAERLGKNTLRARQVSARVGELGCALEGDRVVLTGRAVTVLRGTLTV